QPKRFDVGAVEFQGNNPIPTLTSISPSSGVRGTTVAVTLTGTNLIGTTAVTVSGTGVTVPSFTAVNSTTITANFTITANAALTPTRNVSVTSSGGTSNAVTFTVQTPPLGTLSKISPSSGSRGSSVHVTLTGTNLGGATGVNAPGSSNVTVTNFARVSATQVTAILNLAPGTTL